MRTFAPDAASVASTDRPSSAAPLSAEGDLEAASPASLDEIVLAAPATTLERLHLLALALRALKPGGVLTVSASRNRGGLRLRRELERFGCKVEEHSHHHARLCHAVRPQALIGLDEAIKAGALRYDDALGLWTQPGLFAWDRIDAGTALLLAHLPDLAGQGADFGCGLGVLARDILQQPAVTQLSLIDNDARAIAAARRNIEDARARFIHADIVSHRFATPLDFVVANPPFHMQGQENRALGVAFIEAAARSLRKGGRFWCVANRHLPYEVTLRASFGKFTEVVAEGGFKIMTATK